MYVWVDQFNKNSHIETTQNSVGTIKTEVTRRDDTLTIEAQTRRNGSGASRLFIRNNDGEHVALNGSQLRTLYRVLGRHLEETGKAL